MFNIIEFSFNSICMFNIIELSSITPMKKNYIFPFKIIMLKMMFGLMILNFLKNKNMIEIHVYMCVLSMYVFQIIE